jgi:hypothetical protein
MYVREFFVLVPVYFFVANTSMNVQRMYLQQKNIHGLKQIIHEHIWMQIIFKPKIKYYSNFVKSNNTS